MRGDSGFCVDEIMAWCERQRAVYYCLGLPQNAVLLEKSARAMMDAQSRRIIAKAEVTAQGDTPRFVATHLPAGGFSDDEDPTRFDPPRLYEELYCARGEMENVLKQQVLDLPGDRMITHPLVSNQWRLWLATFACLLLERVRALGLWGTELAQATVESVRLDGHHFSSYPENGAMLRN